MELLKFFVIVSWLAVYIFERYLLKLQLETLESAGIPLALRTSVGRTRFTKCKAYLIALRHYEKLHQFLVLIFDVILLFTNVVPWIWQESASFLGNHGLDMRNEYYHSLLFLGVLLLWRLILDFVVLVPRHKITPPDGFIKLQEKSYLADFIELGLKKILGGALATVVAIYLKKAEAPSSALYFLPCFFAITIYCLRFLSPTSEFDKLTPLEEGELKEKIKLLASSSKFPLGSIMVGSKIRHRDNTTVVYTSGIQTKSIILDQRLIYEGNNSLFSNFDERTAMVVHEIGRWKFSNPAYDVTIIVVSALIYVGIFDHVAYSSNLYSSIFGFQERSVAVGILLFLYVIIPTNVLFRFAMNAKTRSLEFKADAFIRQIGYEAAFRTCLVKFMDNYLSMKEIDNDPWFSAYRLSQPSFIERLEALDD